MIVVHTNKNEYERDVQKPGQKSQRSDVQIIIIIIIITIIIIIIIIIHSL